MVKMMVPNQQKDLILPAKATSLKSAPLKFIPFNSIPRSIPLKSTPGPTIHCSFVPGTNL